MALLDGILPWQGNGLLSQLFPEYGGGGYERLPPNLEAQLAQEARDAAAKRMGQRNQGTADMSLLDPSGPPSLTQQIMPTGPSGPSLNQPMQPGVPPQGMAPLPPPTNVPQLNVAGLPQEQAQYPTDVSSRARAPMAPAAPTPAQVAQPQMPESLGGGDRMKAALGGLTHSDTLLGGLLNAGYAGVTGERLDSQGQAQQNQTMTARAIFQALVSKGHPPQQAMGIAMAASVNPAVAQAVLPEALGTRKPSGNIKIGNMEIPYLIGDGGHAQLVLPGGGNVNSLQDLISFNQKTEAESARQKASAEKIGEAQGNATATLPNTLTQADYGLKLSEDLLSHPGKKWAFGVIAGNLPAIPGTSQADFITRLDQLKGSGFLTAYKDLRGGGQISNIEGGKAEAAVARLSRAQTEGEFNTSLREYMEVIKKGRDNAIKISQGKMQPYPIEQGLNTPPASNGLTEGATATNPQTGQRVKFIGGQWQPTQ